MVAYWDEHDVIYVLICVDFAFMLLIGLEVTCVILRLSRIAHENHIVCHGCSSCSNVRMSPRYDFDTKIAKFSQLM